MNIFNELNTKISGLAGEMLAAVEAGDEYPQASNLWRMLNFTVLYLCR